MNTFLPEGLRRSPDGSMPAKVRHADHDNDAIDHPAGLVFAVTGPSGAGKTSLVREFVARTGGAPSRAVTTRSPRPSETQTQQYEYVTPEQFKALQAAGELCCSTEFCGHLYGHRQSYLDEQLGQSRALILDTVVPPATLRECLQDRVIIVMVLAERSVLADRLQQRATSSPDDLNRRLADVDRWNELEHRCDCVIRTDESSEGTSAIFLRQLLRLRRRSREQIDALFQRLEPVFIHRKKHLRRWPDRAAFGPDY